MSRVPSSIQTRAVTNNIFAFPSENKKNEKCCKFIQLNVLNLSDNPLLYDYIFYI